MATPIATALGTEPGSVFLSCRFERGGSKGFVTVLLRAPRVLLCEHPLLDDRRTQSPSDVLQEISAPMPSPLRARARSRLLAPTQARAADRNLAIGAPQGALPPQRSDR